MNYLKAYCNLIRKTENRTPPEGYTEKHHTFPISIFGKNKRVVVLTAREHYIAHALLERICIKRYGSKSDMSRKMNYAHTCMKSGGKYFNSYLYESARMRRSEFMKGNTYMNGKKLSEETKNKISNTIKGENHPWYGKKHLEETKRKISESRKGLKLSEETKRKIGEKSKGNKHLLGRKFSEETKRKMSESRIGNKNTLGRKHTDEAKEKISEAIRGRKFWNNGEITKLSKESPGDGWTLGIIYK